MGWSIMELAGCSEFTVGIHRESNFSQIDKEALSKVQGIKKVHWYLYEWKFTVLINPKPLVHIQEYVKHSNCLNTAMCSLSGYDRDNVCLGRWDPKYCPDYPLPQKINAENENIDEITCTHQVLLPLTHKQFSTDMRRDKTLLKVLWLIMKGRLEHVDS